MIKTQGEKISELNALVRKQVILIQDLQDKVESMKTKARYWETLQNVITEHVILQSEWQRFVMFMKLCDSEAFKDPITGRRE
jgi:hypothetical protein